MDGQVRVLDKTAARMVRVAADPITLARVPDLDEQIVYAFVHVTHGYMSSWWRAEGTGITTSVAQRSGVDWFECEWLVMAAMHAVLICEVPVTADTVESLAYQAALIYQEEKG